MMNNDLDAAAAGPWCCYNDNAGEAAAAAAAAAVPTMNESSSRFFADMVGGYSTDDLFELLWEQDGATGSMQPAVSCLWSPRQLGSSKPPPPDVRFDPPSEDEMAAWLGAIVKGEEELACNDDDDGSGRPTTDDGRDAVRAANKGTSTTVMDDRKENIPTATTERIMMCDKEMRKAPSVGGSSRRSHYGEAHNLTEKRRRQKINDRLKILQQLVPGCSKCNQASTLDQTIHYMKSLQHHVQAMSVGLTSPPAVYPAMQPQCVPPMGTPVAMPFPAAPMVLGGHQPPPTTMVPYGTTVLPLPHYPAAAVMMPLYPAAAPTSTAVAPGDAVSANHLHGSTSSRSKRRGKGSISMCQE